MRIRSNRASISEECRFSDCSHDTELECAVRAATESGALAHERLAASESLRLNGSHPKNGLLARRRLAWR
jgi:putative ribosome biogenesis GTPase RsgA